MFSLCYVSKLNADVDVQGLVELASNNGSSENVTGYLSWDHSKFFHYLEGDKNRVLVLMELIERDPRHQIIRKLELKRTTNRRFEHWYYRRLRSTDTSDINLSDLLENVMHSMATPIFEESTVSTLVVSLLAKLSLNKNVEHRLVLSTQSPPTENPSLTLFCIGASAGGLSPVREIISSLPLNLNAAFVIIQHLSPDYESLLDVILERYTQLPIQIAEQDMPLEVSNIYIIPKGINLSIKNDGFDLTPQDRESKKLQLPINIFLESAAREYGSRAVSIILSGTGTDGMVGSRAIYEAGGIVLAQTTESAEFDGMPRAVIESGIAHQAFDPAGIAKQITKVTELIGDSAKASGAKITRPVLERIIDCLTNKSIDFSHYKQESILRGIDRRRVLASCDTMESYLKHLNETPSEKEQLRKDLLISVTSFFRDDEAWDEIDNVTIPNILETLSDGDTFRVWVAGCATGEEAYSIAILLMEHLKKSGRKIDFKIYATDLSNQAVDIASNAVYTDVALQALSHERKKRYFNEVENGYQIIKSVRDRVIVATHNMVKDTPFTRLHLVSCRNVLIYMQPELQQQVLRSLHHSLVIGGTLFLGASESLGALENEFTIKNLEWNIVEKVRESRLPLHFSSILLHATQRTAKKSTTVTNGTSNGAELYETMVQLIAQATKKTVILSNEARKVLMIGDDPSGLLVVKTGRPTDDIADMVIEGLGPTLTIAIQHACQENKTIRYTGLHCKNKNNNEPRLIDMEVTPNFSDDNETNVLIMLGESVNELGPTSDLPSNIRHVVESTQVQLNETRQALQSTIKELEIANEQSQSSNQQLIIVNKELQSTNEELQSVSEELYTVNFEYQRKIHEFSDLTHDLENLLKGSNVGVIFLDNELRIRRFSDRAVDVVNVLQQDIGRRFIDLAHDLDFPDLDEAIKRVKSLGIPQERDVTFQGDVARLHVGIHPYRVGTDLTQGVLITFLDLANLKTYSPMAMEELNDVDSADTVNIVSELHTTDDNNIVDESDLADTEAVNDKVVQKFV